LPREAEFLSSGSWLIFHNMLIVFHRRMSINPCGVNRHTVQSAKVGTYSIRDVWRKHIVNIVYLAYPGPRDGKAYDQG